MQKVYTFEYVILSYDQQEDIYSSSHLFAEVSARTKMEAYKTFFKHHDGGIINIIKVTLKRGK